MTLALVTYTDEIGMHQTQLAIVGENNIHILNARDMGISDSTNQGIASGWLKDGIFKKLGK